MKTTAISISLLSLITLTACGGGSADPTAAGDPPIVFPSFVGAGNGPMPQTELVSELEKAASFVTALTVENTAAPTQARVNLDGFVAINNADASTLAGNLTMNADFNERTLDGSTSDFTFFGTPNATTGVINLDGSLAISEAAMLDRVENGQFSDPFTADLDGTLTADGLTFEVDTQMEGGFFSVDGKNAAAGLITGTVGDGTGNTDPLLIGSGAFGAFQ